MPFESFPGGKHMNNLSFALWRKENKILAFYFCCGFIFDNRKQHSVMFFFKCSVISHEHRPGGCEMGKCLKRSVGSRKK